MQALTLSLAWLAGTALGTLFYGGLWWTVRAITGAARGALYLFGSLLLRMGVSALGFYLVAGGQWQRMLVCLLGFLMARAAVLYLSAASARKEGRHAPKS
ncbi:ATP synthase subunit I [Janthinobacterium sp. ROICE36]|uniref:ATP synthase subunit I n=1 Tax=Janthinobacterium sp. ROICE36 TaxID=2048670 RepID=UPI000C7F3B13|nr:ATP synthase subunit I [Janthinobacterium sp. ROICE36]PLY39603.1 ATP synthase subunit I [Janthinobacterium sp. ROICE36]